MPAGLLGLHGALAWGVMSCACANAGYNGDRDMRQLLVARPGQQPNIWYSWDEVRNILLDGDDHAIVAACVSPAPHAGSGRP